jgi:mannose-1-phosphate guanylyltransferase
VAASREVRPKQFLSLFGKRSTFQDTLVKVSDAALFERPIVITNAAHRFMVLEQLAEIGIEADVILELTDAYTAEDEPERRSANKSAKVVLAH